MEMMQVFAKIPVQELPEKSARKPSPPPPAKFGVTIQSLESGEATSPPGRRNPKTVECRHQPLQARPRTRWSRDA